MRLRVKRFKERCHIEVVHNGPDAHTLSPDRIRYVPVDDVGANGLFEARNKCLSGPYPSPWQSGLAKAADTTMALPLPSSESFRLPPRRFYILHTGTGVRAGADNLRSGFLQSDRTVRPVVERRNERHPDPVRADREKQPAVLRDEVKLPVHVPEKARSGMRIGPVVDLSATSTHTGSSVSGWKP